MTKIDFYTAVKNTIASTFKVNKSMITPQTTSNDIEEWDSLGHIQLILKIESFFKIRFHTVDIPKLTNIEAIVRKLEKYEQSI